MPKARPVQAIFGEDTYLAEAALERLLSATVGSDRQDSLRVLYGDEAKWEDVLAAARSGSLFAASRAVLVRRAKLLKYASAPQADDAPADAKGRGKAAKTDGDPVEAYLESPAPDATAGFRPTSAPPSSCSPTAACAPQSSPPSARSSSPGARR